MGFLQVLRVTLWVKHPLLLAEDDLHLGAIVQGCCLNGFEASCGLYGTPKVGVASPICDTSIYGCYLTHFNGAFMGFPKTCGYPNSIQEMEG